MTSRTSPPVVGHTIHTESRDRPDNRQQTTDKTWTKPQIKGTVLQVLIYFSILNFRLGSLQRQEDIQGTWVWVRVRARFRVRLRVRLKGEWGRVKIQTERKGPNLDPTTNLNPSPTLNLNLDTNPYPCPLPLTITPRKSP